MRKKGLLLDVIQPMFRETCNVEEVIRTLNIALLCVQHQPEKRPKMSKVVTMFFGNMNVEVSSDEVDSATSDFRNILGEAFDYPAELPGMEAIEEESPGLQLLGRDAHLSWSFSKSATSSSSHLELRTTSGK
jgi:hypothetical protein